VWHLLDDPRTRSAVAVAERYADGEATTDELAAAQNAAGDAAAEGADPSQVEGDDRTAAAFAASFVCGAELYEAGVASAVVCALPPDASATDRARREQAALLACVVGRRRRPAVEPAWLTWNGGIVRALAAAAYESRDFGRLPLLADALEDTGCAEADLLAHLRGPGPHCRGCWVVDVLLGKEGAP
jgi:hypothetical protein